MEGERGKGGRGRALRAGRGQEGGRKGGTGGRGLQCTLVYCSVRLYGSKGGEVRGSRGWSRSRLGGFSRGLRVLFTAVTALGFRHVLV